jgi:ABC-type nitrate/sulfonate/bicarbonate transport system substrate-binding protein
MNNNSPTRHALMIAVICLAFSACWHPGALSKPVRFGISPYQDTLLPIIGEEKHWYAGEGLGVQFKYLGWTEVMEALSSGQVDVALGNMSLVISTHERNPELIYVYALNPFDDGFALMVRPRGPLKALSVVLQQYPDRAAAVRATAAQLKGKTVITTGNTDMEQGVAAAALRGGLDFRKDVHIIDLNPDEGLAAFLRGEGDAYIGGIPQRTRAAKEGMTEMLTGADLGPPPINGLVSTRTYAAAHQGEILKILKVWFRSVRYVDQNRADGAGIIIGKLNAMSAASFTIADFNRFWNISEHFPASPKEVASMILEPSGRDYWAASWDNCNHYFLDISKTIKKPVPAEGVFIMPDIQAAYLSRYGTQ